MEVTQEKVTPAKAEKWLNQNTGNRKMRPGVAEKYAADMKANRWTDCTDPIAWYDGGFELANGQHRLWAICESGVAQTFIVVRNLPRDAGLNIDTGLGRTLVDNARISKSDDGLSNELVGVCRSIEDGTHANIGNNTRGPRSNAEKLAIVQKHREVGNWVCHNGPRGKLLRNSIVLAAMGRAWYAEKDKDRLRRFADVLTTGLYNDDGETAGVALRNYLMLKGSTTSSSALWRDTFLKSQNAIHYFMRGKRLTAVKKIETESYPLAKRK
jgi:hypothetical protein